MNAHFNPCHVISCADNPCSQWRQAVELGSGICVIEEIGNSTGTNPYKTTDTDATDVNAIHTDMAVEWPSCGRDGAVMGP